MPPGRSALSVVKGAAVLLAAALLAGCVREAVLENDVRSAQSKARTLSTAADPVLASAALSAQLVELEALYQRDPSDPRIRVLLERGYVLMARGFIELRRLEAAATGDSARADQEAQLRADAERRAEYYAPQPRTALELGFEPTLRGAEAACRQHDRAGYERLLNEALARPESSPGVRLEHALGRRLAALWLTPKVSSRCAFNASP